MPHLAVPVTFEIPGAAVNPITGNTEYGGACWNGDHTSPKALYGIYHGGEMRCYRTIGDHRSFALVNDSVEYLSTIVAGTFKKRRSCGLTYIDGTIYAIVAGGDDLNGRTGTWIYRDTGGGGTGPWVEHGAVASFAGGSFVSHRHQDYLTQSTEILVTSSGRWWVNHLRCDDVDGRAYVGLAYSDTGGSSWTILFDRYDNEIGVNEYEYTRTQPTWGKSAAGDWWWTANGNEASSIRFRIPDSGGVGVEVSQGGSEDYVGGNFAPSYQFSVKDKLHRVVNGVLIVGDQSTVDSTTGEPDTPPTWTTLFNWGDLYLGHSDLANPGVHNIGPTRRPYLTMVQAGSVLGIGKAQGGPTTGFIGFGTF